MEGQRRFGFSAKVRGRAYLVLSYALFLGLFVAGQYRNYLIGAVAILILWIMLFDPVNSKGQRTIFGFGRDQAGKFGIGSIFGWKLDD